MFTLPCLMVGPFPIKLVQGSILALARSLLESNISEWKVKKANEPKILAGSGNYF